MKLINPVAVSGGVLADSNVSEETAWAIGTTYALDASVRVGATLYQSQAGSNVGNDPATDDGTWWVATGAANRWKMFDNAVNTQTERADSIEVELAPTGFVDALALLNVSAATAQVVFTVDGTDIFDQTYTLLDDSAVIDWWTYFFEPIRRQTDLAITGIPSYYSPEITVTLAESGATVKCGALVIGQLATIGVTGMGASIGYDDFSRVVEDEFGVSALIKRDYRRRGNYPVKIENTALDGVFRLLTEIRGTLVVWIPSDTYGSTFTYGWARELNIEIAYPHHSNCNLNLIGVT